MDKKRKCASPTIAEREDEYDKKEGRKRIKRGKTEELAPNVKDSSGDKSLHDLQVKEANHSEDSVKTKLELGAKRTKKPPKSLENFICRPTLRVSQRSAPVIAHSLRTVQKNPYSDALATNTISSVTCPSNLSPSPAIPSEKMTPGSDSPNTMTAKKVLPKQSKKRDLKSDLTLEQPTYTNQPPSNKLPFSHNKTHLKQRSLTHDPSSLSPLQRDSSPQEGIRLPNEDTIQQANFCQNSNHVNPCENNSYTLLSNRNSEYPKQTCTLDNASKCTENNSEMSLSLNLKLSKMEAECCVDDLESAKNRFSETVTNEENENEHVFMQPPSHCSNDPPIHVPSALVANSSSPNKSADGTCDSLESNETNGRNENKDFNRASERTMNLSQTVQHQQIDGRTEGLTDDDCGKKVKHNPNQELIKACCSSDTVTCAGSTLNPQAKSSMDVIPTHKNCDKNLSKKQKIKQFPCSKIAKTKRTKHHLVGCTTSLQSCSQNGAPSLALSSSPSEQKKSGQLPVSEKSQNSTTTSVKSSSKKTQPKKRGRPTNKLEVQLQSKSSQLLDAKPTNNETQDPDLKIKQPRPLTKKRGRPKRSFSVQEQGTQPALISGEQDTGEHNKTSKDKMQDTQMLTRSNKLMMNTIIGKINKMGVKRRDQVLKQILLGQKQCDSTDFSQEGQGANLCSPASTAKHSLSSLVTSFGGKLGPQINVSKRGTIYMGKRRGRKPKYQKNSSLASALMSPGTSVHQSVDIKSGSFSGTSGTLKNVAPSLLPGRSSHKNLNNQKIKTTIINQLSEQHHSKALCEPALTYNTGKGSNTSSLDRETNSRVAASAGFTPTLATGAVFTTSGVTGSNSIKSRPKGLSCLPSEHPYFAHLQLSSERSQDSSGTNAASSLLSFTGQEAHKFKYHRKSHHCLSHDRIRRHKYKCKKKYMQLRAKRHDPDFLAEVEDLVVRLSEIHIVHHITRTRLEKDGCIEGRKSLKGKSQPHDHHSLQEKVHSPTMFQINLSGYYTPHTAVSCDQPNYVRMANMRRKHGCSSESSEQIVTHFPVMHKLGYPLSGGGFYHPSYKVPFTTASLGFGLYQGYPPTTGLYPPNFPPSHMHHYSKNPIISPSRFHKKKAKFPRQNSVHWGGKTLGTYPRLTTHIPCDCFSRQSWQREKQKEEDREGRDEHGRTREKEHGIEWLFWQNKNTKDIENTGDCSSNHPSSSVFSRIQNNDNSFMHAHVGISNLKDAGEVRWSDNQPPRRWAGGLESKLGNRSPNKEYHSKDRGGALEGRESDLDLTSFQHSSSRTSSFLKKPKLFSSLQSLRKIGKINGGTAVSKVLMDQDGTSVHYADESVEDHVQLGSSHFSGKRQCSTSSSARAPEESQREPMGHMSHRSPCIQEQSGQVCQTSLHLIHPNPHPSLKQPTNATSLRGKPQPHLKMSRPQNHQNLGNELKKRGRGRPRKNPLPSSPSLPFTTQLNPQLTEERENSGKSERSKIHGDTVLGAIETVIHVHQRRGRKRNKTEKEREGSQKLNEENDGTKPSSESHMSSTSTGPSPSQVAPIDADSQKSLAIPPKKKYLWAGLYSDNYKTENIPCEPPQLNIESVDYYPDENEHGLLPPPLHVGMYLRLKRIDFQLPYNIYWLCAHNKLFKKSDSLSQGTTKLSHILPNENVPQYCNGDDHRTMLADEMNQTDRVSKTQLHEKDEQLLKQQEKNCDNENNENFPSPLSSEERSFVIKHGVFLVRNYEKMRVRRALLLKEGVMEQETEKEKEREESNQNRCLIERRSFPEEEHLRHCRINLTRTLQEIWDCIVSCKGSSGQTLSAPLLNLCSRKRSDSALLDLSTVQSQLLMGHYKSLEAFHADMLRVFHSAEKYYGSESSVGRDVSQLRDAYHKAHQEASAKISTIQQGL